MRKFIKSALCMTICASTVLGVAACGPKKESYDSTKTQLFVQTYAGGYGTAWIDRVGDRFEAMYADYKVGEKVGVEIIPVPTTELGSGVDNHWITNTNEIFFLEQTIYHRMQEKGRFLDITDIMTEKLTAYGEDKSIAEKMDPTLAEYYNEGTATAPKYYALNYSNSYEGIIYDEDMFYQSGFYFTKEVDEARKTNAWTNTEDYLITPNTQKGADGNYAQLTTVGETVYYKTTSGEYLSHGPDGEYGTRDDGQAATYSEFFALCDYMKDEHGVTPIIMAGKAVTGYLAWLARQLIADFEGEEQMRMNLEFEGTSKLLIDVDAEGNVTKLSETELNDENRLTQYKSAGRYYALKFMEKLFTNGGQKYMNARSFADSVDQIRAQEYFVYSAKDNEKYAFSVDGCWWENEAESTINTMASNFGDQYAKANRRFRVLSLPKATNEQIGQKSTFYEGHNFCGFIRSDIATEKVEIAKKFFQFCFTDESNSEFTAYTGVTRPFAYDIKEEHKSAMSFFAKDAMALKASKNVDIMYPAPDSAYYIRNYDMITGLGFYASHVDGTDYSSLLEMFRTKGFSAETIFNGIYTRAQNELS
ncbi:MAG: hypothetical protein IKA88_06660 [Clostridia bacterium]|nr:hypothetical protein [Clostridia bacterium]